MVHLSHMLLVYAEDLPTHPFIPHCPMGHMAEILALPHTAASLKHHLDSETSKDNSQLLRGQVPMDNCPAMSSSALLRLRLLREASLGHG